MLNKLIKIITDYLVARCERNGRVFYITGGTNGKTVYLVRYIVFKSKRMCIYVHRFLRSDADDPHDHPWNFFTYVISGGYKEVFYNRNRPVFGMGGVIENNGQDVFVVTCKGPLKFVSLWSDHVNERLPGSLAYRRATDIHKVVVDNQIEVELKQHMTEEDNKKIKQAPYTICIIGKRRREWGFWPKEKGQLDGSKFVDWRRYLSIVPGDSRIEGGE